MKVAFVIPWYGDIPGGAESACRSYAERLKKIGIEVEVLTTCIKEFLSDWNIDYYKEGVYDLNGVMIRRFKVKKRDSQLFNSINYKLMHKQRVTIEEEIQFIDNMVNSDDLYNYIYANRSQYDYFLFIPYMFGTTYFGSRICFEKSIIIPCLHNESYVYMSIYKEMIESAKGLIFLSDPEKTLAERIFNLPKKNSVIGLGVDTNINYNVERFRAKYGINDPFVLYAGRRELGKNVPLLLEYFCKYKQRVNNNIKLVLIGSGEIAIPERCKNDILDLGFISRRDKSDAYAASLVLCQPSINESFSIVVMESWLCNTPVLVNAMCTVTKGHCLKSNGGLYFRSYVEFEDCLEYYVHHPMLAKKMGELGKNYVLSNYSWSIVLERLITFLTLTLIVGE